MNPRYGRKRAPAIGITDAYYVLGAKALESLQDVESLETLSWILFYATNRSEFRLRSNVHAIATHSFDDLG